MIERHSSPNETPGENELSYPVPNPDDLVVIEYVDSKGQHYQPIELDTPHSENAKVGADLRLVWQGPTSADPNKMVRVYSGPRTNQDVYNFAREYSGESNAGPIFIRSYLERRDSYVALPKGLPLTGVTGIQLISGGAGYDDANPPIVSLVGGGGSGATAIAKVVGGIVVSIRITSQGSGYAAAPSVAFDTGDAVGTASIQPPSAVLVKEEVKKITDELPEMFRGWNEAMLGGLFVRVLRVYETLPGPWIPYSRWDDNLGAVRGRKRFVLTGYALELNFSDGTRNYTWREANGRYVLEGSDPNDPTLWFVDITREDYGSNATATVYEIVEEAQVGHWKFERINGGWSLVVDNPEESTSIPPVIPDGFEFWNPTQIASSSPTTKTTYESREGSSVVSVETHESWGDVPYDHRFSVEIPDPIPAEWRDLLPTRTAEQTEVGIAEPPELEPGQTAASSAEVNKFWRHESVTGRDLTLLPITRHDFELDGINAGGSEFGGVFDNARTLAAGPQSVEEGFDITKSSVKQLSNGLTLRETKRLGGALPARLLLTFPGSGFGSNPAVVFGEGNAGSGAAGTPILSSAPVIPPEGEPGGTFPLNFNSFGDNKGIFYFLGARYNGGVWRNPATAGNVRIVGASTSPLSPEQLAKTVDRSAAAQIVVIPNSTGSHHIVIDIGVGKRLKANRITIRQADPGPAGGTVIMRNLRVQAANDFVTAVDLGSDVPIPQNAGEWSQGALDDSEGYRYFRVFGTDQSIPGVFPRIWPALIIGEIELYGEIEIVPGVVRSYSFDGDQNGVFFDLGARGNNGVWRNPHTNGDIECAADDLTFGAIDDLVNREPSNVGLGAGTGKAIYFDLLEGRSLICNKLSFRQRNTSAAIACSVQLQGTNDPTFVTSDWHALVSFVTPTAQDAWKTIDVPGTTGYRRFRLISATSGFRIGEVELYGALTFPPETVPDPTFSIESIDVTSPGTGYPVPPAVIIEGDGTGAAGTAVLNDDGGVESVLMTNHGSGYTEATVRFSGIGLVGSGAAATAIIDGQVQSVNVDEGGADYEVPPVVGFVGSGTGAAGDAVLAFLLTSIGLTNPGINYSAPPEVIIDPPNATAHSILAFALDSINVDNGGSGYSTATVDIDAPTGVGGVQATAHAVLTGDVVTSIVIDNPGSGYLDPPVIAISGDGTDAEASAVLESLGVVDHIEIDDNGEFETFPDITLDGDGTGATAVPNLAAGGRVIRIELTDPGTNYQSAPDVTLTPVGADPGTGAEASCEIAGPVTGFNLTDGGGGYEVAPLVNIPGDATATAQIDGGEVTGLTLGDPGADYPEAPPVVFAPVGGPEGEATIAFGVDHIDVDEGGSGYAVEPPVEIVGVGRSASARAILGRSLAEIEVIAGGDNYGSSLTVVLSAPGGVGGATATAQRSFGIESATVTDGGSDYDSDPIVTAPAPTGGVDAIFQAIRGLPIRSVVMTQPGQDYDTPPTVGFAAPFPVVGTTAVGAAILGFGLASVAMDSMGSNYLTPPTVEVRPKPTGGGGATAIAELLGRTLASIFVDNGGTGYTTPPTIVIGDGSNGAAHAVLTGDVITSIVIDDPGSGFQGAPDILILGDGGGSGAHAVGILSAGQDMRIVVTNPGQGFEEVPDIILTGGGGSGAAATGTLATTGGVKRVELSDQGSDYSIDTPVVFTPTGTGSGAAGNAVRDLTAAGPIALIAVIQPGSGYIATTINCVITGGGGTDATAVAVKKTLGSIKSITVTNAGGGFEAPPIVTITQGMGGIGAGVVLRAILQPTGKVKRVIMTGIGEGYFEAPTIGFPANDGTGAEATAFLTETGSIETLVLTVPGGPFSVPPSVSFVPPGDEPLATALYLLAQVWPTLIDELTDPTDKLIVQITKDIKPYGTALPPGYSEMQALNKYRSIQIVSKIDLSRLPSPETYLTTQHVGLPNQLLAVSPVWSQRVARSTSINQNHSDGNASAAAEISGSILVLKTGGFRGAAISRVQRVHFNGVPPDASVPLPTIIRPSTGTAFIKGGANSVARAGSPNGPILNFAGQPAQIGDLMGYNPIDGLPYYYAGGLGIAGPNITTSSSSSISSNLQIVDISDVLTNGINFATVNGVVQESGAGDPGALDVHAEVEGTFGVSMPASCPASLQPGSSILQEVGVEKRRFNLYVRTLVYVIVPGMCEAVGSGGSA